VKVLHLWEKNCVFPPEVINTLLQMDVSGGSSQALSDASSAAATTVAAAGTNIFI
jgi:hypothetical protein